MVRIFLIAFSLITVIFAENAQSQSNDPFDLNSFGFSSEDSSVEDKDKTAEQLFAESIDLLRQERPLDARTKLLNLLKKDPKNYRAYLLLSDYYSEYVNHFRLAMKYLKRAEQLFTEQNGKPPYLDYEIQNDHANILFSLSQLRLNLDNYQGALDTLDEYTEFGYYRVSYPAARAWVLMKLGRLEEAIKIARLGTLSEGETGRTLNMLGILLSMHGEPDAALKALREAIAYESSSTNGRPGTPLNNSGEVYKEIFQDDKAETSWLRATQGAKDGCDHVLPALNLSLLYIDQAKYQNASRAMDNFESCVSQFPLRNGEEHKSLVNLIRGRVALHTGNIDKAISLLEEALESIQWFGKIGTSREDLQVGVLSTLGSAYAAREKIRSSTYRASILETISDLKDNSLDRIKSWWAFRQARYLLTSKLNNFEDLSVRNTDSLLEYSSLGELVSGFPYSTFNKRLEVEEERDKRDLAKPYYETYRASVAINSWFGPSVKNLLSEVLDRSRIGYDEGLKIYARLLLLSYFEPKSREYEDLSTLIFTTAKAAIRNHGYKLTVNFQGDDKEILNALEKTSFLVDNTHGRNFTVIAEKVRDEYLLEFRSLVGSPKKITARGTELEKVINRLNDAVFTESLDNKR